MTIEFNSRATAEFEENGTGIIRNIQASLDGGAVDAGITYSITGGADQALFAVDANTGELSFISTPDFEAPTDAGANNIYEVEVTASDGGLDTATQSLTITVTNDAVESVITDAIRPSIELSEIDGYNGFVLNGVDATSQSGGYVSSAGDINGDGIDDLLIGVRFGGGTGVDRFGESYIVFGNNTGFAPSIDLSTLDGTNGFTLRGVASSTGFSDSTVSNAGDVNGDGFDDIIVAANAAGPNGLTNAGQSFVVFGKAGGFDAEIDLSSLSSGDSSVGFALNGVESGDFSGRVSNAGDFNGDGFDDVLISAISADANGVANAGETYLVFGKASGFAASFNLSDLDGNNGFVINGINVADLSGRISNAGDINGDGFDDILIGAGGAGPAGESYVLFGKESGFTASFNLSDLDGINGFVINGVNAGDYSGTSVSNAGDVNGDGYDDILIGSSSSDVNGENSGESYLVFGKASGFTASFNLSDLDGTNGFTITGAEAGARNGSPVSKAGDVNGDGFDDVLVTSGHGGLAENQSYIIFGKASGFTSSIDILTLDGSDGIVVNSFDRNDFGATSVSSAGDINGDGFDDLVFGSPIVDIDGKFDVGKTFIVYGGPTLAAIQFSSNGTASFEENSTGIVRNIQASLSDGMIDANLSYGITGGTDQALFNVNSTTGELSFINAPDFETPLDAGGNNIYDVEVTATGTGGGAATQSLTVTVTDRTIETAIGNTVTTIELSDLDGTNGFVINGIDPADFSGRSISDAGDINGDGFDDFIIGAGYADPNSSTTAGESYVIFGSDTSAGPSLDLSNLDGSNGFVINGIDQFDVSGFSVSSAGDINGDGFDDLIIGAYKASPNGNYSGESYVVFGSATSPGASLNLSDLNGTNGFIIHGIDEFDQSGGSVSSAGDINGDGFDDLLIGAFRADPSGNSNAGESYVIFGSAAANSTVFELSSLDGANGFTITGIDPTDYSGRSVSAAGDVNGDGFDDIIIGANFADPSGNDRAGESYVIYGSASGPGASIDLSILDGTNGFVINGIDSFGESGFSISGVGDFNGDGFDDLVIGAPIAQGTGAVEGESYIIFGSSTGPGASLDLSNLVGNNGFTIIGVSAASQAGGAVSGAGDLNGDGFDDLIIGANQASPNGTFSGASYVIFGSDTSPGAVLMLSALNGTNGFAINGVGEFDESGFAVSSAGDVNGDGFDDILIGANKADPDGNNGAGETYLIFGGPTLTPSPVFSSTDTASVAENTTGTVLNADSSVDNGATDSGVTYSLTGGADQTLFIIDSASGTLSFIAAPDFDIAGDSDSDNIYDVTITATSTLGQTTRQAVTIDVTNIEEAAVVAGTFTDTATEGNVGDALVTATGSLSISDEDAGQDPAFEDQASVTGDNGFGSFVLTSGTWTYTLDQSAVQDLDAGDVVTDTITYTATDNSAQQITVTITGADDAPVITGTVTDTATEGDVGDAPVTATGSISINDVDANDSPSFNDVASTTGDNGFGNFVLTSGTWTYTLGQSVVQDLDAGDVVTDTITYTATDNSTQQITVTITGADDAPVVTTTPTGAITEGNVGDASATVSGTLSINDADADDNVSFDDVAAVSGDNGFGSFALISGTWTYTLDQSAVQDLDAGDTVTDTITYTATNNATQQITVTLTGTDDAATISGGFIGTVTEGDVGDAAVTATGALSISDVDANDSPSFNDVASTTGDNGFGSFALTSDTWTYTLDQSAVQSLNSGETSTDTTTYTATDGSTQQITVTINGADEASSSSGGSSGGGSSGGSSSGGSSGGSSAGSSSGGSSSGVPLSGTVADPIDGTDTVDTLEGSAADDNIDGGGGADVLSGGAGSDSVAGGAGDDVVDGGEGDDTVNGGEGNDSIDGGVGTDIIEGGAGDDIVEGGAGNDRITAGADDTGDDTLEGNSGGDFVGGGAGNDFIVGGTRGDGVGASEDAGNDTLEGGEGDDIIIAGNFDTATGTVVNTGSGDNLIIAGTGNDSVFGDDGLDVVGAGTGDDNISAAGGDDKVFGSFGQDSVDGGSGNDTLFGGGGNDTVNGGTGNDEIWGSAGDDVISGGAGNDSFRFITGFGADTISDFGATDGDTDTLDLGFIPGLTLEGLLATATFTNGNATLTVGTEGSIILEGIDQAELQAIFDAGQVLV